MAGSEWTVVLEADPDPSLRAKILEPLSAHNDAAAGPGLWATLMWGRTGYGFVFVELLALGPAWGGGIGREVMALAEAEARRRGLVGMWLDTWTFQAPGFYQKLGFTECGRITEYPAGHDRIFYVKRFT